MKHLRLSRETFGRALALLVPTALALVIRMSGTLQDSIWADELHVVGAARQGVARAIQVAATDVYPPLFYVFAALVDPADPHHLRLISVIAGVLAVSCVSGFALALGEPRAAWVGGIWLALLPAHVHWSQEARAYAVVGLLVVVLAGNILVRGPAIVSALVTAALLYTHGLAPVYLLAVAVPLVWSRDWRQVAAVGAGTCTFLPWLGLGLSQGQRYQSFRGDSLTWGAFVSDTVAYVGSGHLGTWWAWCTGVPVLLLLGFLARREARALGLLLGSILVFGVLAAAAPGLGGLMGKHALPIAGLLALALGLGVDTLSARRAALVAVVALSAPAYGLLQGAARDPVRFDVRAVIASVSAARSSGPLASNHPALVRLYDPSAVLGVPLEDPSAMVEIYRWQQRAFEGRARTAWWVVEGAPPELLGQLRSRFPVVWATQSRAALGVAVSLGEGESIPAGAATLERVSLEHAGGTLAFYEAGTARLISGARGTLALWMTASQAVTPLDVRIESAGANRAWRCTASPSLGRVSVGHVEAGDRVELRFADAPSVDGMDANVWVYRVDVGELGELSEACEAS